MENIGTTYNSLIIFFAGIWPLLWILYEIRQIRKHMAKGRTIGGAIIAEIGTLVGGPLIAVMALWIIFSVATPKLEQQGLKYANQSQTGAILFGCLNQGGKCLQANGGQSAPTVNYFPAVTATGLQFFPTSTPLPSTEPPATIPAVTFVPTDQSAPPVVTETPTAAPVSGAPDPTLFDRNPEVAVCVAGQLITSNFASLPEDQIIAPATGYLPAGTHWTLHSPNFWGHTLTGIDSEEWSLCPDAYPGETNCLTVGGSVARALGGGVFVLGNRSETKVVGTGQLPPACWAAATNPTP